MDQRIYALLYHGQCFQFCSLDLQWLTRFDVTNLYPRFDWPSSYFLQASPPFANADQPLGHAAGSTPPIPQRFAPCPVFPLVDSRQICVYLGLVAVSASTFAHTARPFAALPISKSLLILALPASRLYLASRYVSCVS